MCLADRVSSGGTSKPFHMGMAREESATVVFAVVVQHASVDADVRVVGNCSELGSWCSNKGAQLHASAKDESIWEVVVKFPASLSRTVEYKFVLKTPGTDGRTVDAWEHGPNRQVNLDSSGYIVAHFGDTGADASPTPQLMRPPTVTGRSVLWEVFCNATAPGDVLLVVGEDPALGAWNPDDGVRLSTDELSFPHWHGAANVWGLVQKAAWKLVILRAEGGVEWEAGQNREILFLESCDDYSGDFIQASFGNTEECTRTKLPRQHSVDYPESTELGSILDTDSVCYTEWYGSLPSTPAPQREMAPMVCSLQAGLFRVGKGDTCEDACFATDSSLGIADGVGGMSCFKSYGCSSADYAQELMDLSEAFLRRDAADAAAGAPLCRLPEESAAQAIAAAESGATSYGASTVTVACLEGSCLGVASLGDSGFMLLRRDPPNADGSDTGGFRIITRSAEQQHGWNFPFQLMRVPSSLRTSMKRRPDTADDCQRYRVHVQPGDLLLLYSDGMSDNLYEHEILEAVEGLVARSSGGLVEPGLVAQELVMNARAHSVDPAAHVPFEDAAREQAGVVFEGGKVDDITVVAAWVV